jgi:acylphosphatase
MKQCVKIIITGHVQSVSYKEFIQKQAQKLHIEGTLQSHEVDDVLIVACGQSNDLDELIDHIYKGTPDIKIRDVIIEPFINEKNFRGVFRVIG